MTTIRNLMAAGLLVCAALVFSSAPVTAQYSDCWSLGSSCMSQPGCEWNGGIYHCWVVGGSSCVNGQYHVQAHCYNPFTEQIQSGTCTAGECTPEPCPNSPPEPCPALE